MSNLRSGCDTSMKRNKQEIDSQQSLIPSLPDHLILEHILPRLPVKSLIRSRSVCKFWLSTITSPEFVKSQLKFSSLCPQFLILNEDHTEEEHYRLFMLPYDEYNNSKGLVKLDFADIFVFTNLDFVGSCNGLLCLYIEEETKYGNFYIWNPATCQCREILNPDGEAFALDFGFGYASSVDDYKIVALFTPKNCKFGAFYVYSLRSGKWKIIFGFDGFYAASSLDDQTVVINDTLYWPLSNLKDWQKAKCIVGFDLVSEKLKEIPWMNWLGQYNRAYFFEMKGCLSLHCCGDQGSDVWMLKQYGDWKSWERLFAVKLGGMSFLNFTETGKCLVRDLEQLKVVEPSQDASEQHQRGTDFPGRIRGSGSYVESLISPLGTP